MFCRGAIALAIAILAACVPGVASAAKVMRAATACGGAGVVASDEASRLQAIDAILCLVNERRAQFGLPAVRLSGLLGNAAVGHSDDMVLRKFVGHQSANGESFRTRIRRTGYIRKSRYTLLGETLTWGTGMFATPSELVAALMESTPHRRTILDRRFRDVGIGMVLGAPMLGVTGRCATVTLDFGRR